MNERTNRRQFLIAAAGTGVLSLAGTAQHADVGGEHEVADLITSDAQKAIDDGLKFLARTQNRNPEGSFGERDEFRGNVAVTSLAGLAFMSAGHHPGRGEYGDGVLRAVEYVLKRERANPAGFLHHEFSNRQAGMYDHGFGTLFLAEVYGTVADRDLSRRLRGTIERAIRLIETTQNREGGWRYDPTPQSADISVTICQIMALRAARNAGFSVNKQTVDQCLKYVRSCQNADGGYAYYAGQGGSAFARSAAGLVALYSAGVYEGREVERTLRYLMQFKPNLPLARREVPEMHWYYGQYYAAQAMWTAALRTPRYWNDWFPVLRDELLLRLRGQRDAGWNDPAMGRHYATAMALIMLQIPNGYLPILQK